MVVPNLHTDSVSKQNSYDFSISLIQQTVKDRTWKTANRKNPPGPPVPRPDPTAGRSGLQGSSENLMSRNFTEKLDNILRMGWRLKFLLLDNREPKQILIR